jgi:serpin B
LAVLAIGVFCSPFCQGKEIADGSSLKLQKQLVDSNNEFAVKLYAKMAETQYSAGGDPPSFCYSPYSIAALSQIVKAGTGGKTEQELGKALCLNLSDEELNQAYLALMKTLQSPKVRKNETPYELAIANRLWLQQEKNSPVLPSFKEIIQKYYLSSIEEVNFANSSACLKEINDWVSEKTKHHIKKILSDGDIDGLTRFVALNAVYFQGTWRETFNTKATMERPFYASDGKTKLGTVPMMSKTDKRSQLGVVDGVSILRRPYQGGASFVAILPPEGEKGLEKLEASLSNDKLQQWLASARRAPSIRVQLPKFELENKFPLIPVMKQLGVNDLFDGDAADFSGMARPGGWKTLYVDVMRHKATIKVDEEGTVATAATVAVGTWKSIPMKPKSFVADRPFLFMVVDDKTSSILFLGRYTGPEKE